VQAPVCACARVAIAAVVNKRPNFAISRLVNCITSSMSPGVRLFVDCHFGRALETKDGEAALAHSALFGLRSTLAAKPVESDCTGVQQVTQAMSPLGHSLPMRLVPRLARCPEYPESRHEAPAQYLTRWAISGSRIRIDAADCRPLLLHNKFQDQRNRGEQFCSVSDEGGF
jgi:hypothetical protein